MLYINDLNVAQRVNAIGEMALGERVMLSRSHIKSIDVHAKRRSPTRMRNRA